MDSEAKINNLQDDKQNSDVDAASKDGLDQSSRPSSGSRTNLSALHKEREERIKHLKEQQNEERQRKLEELKMQALAAQKFREQKEEERRRRMEELRNRENDRRHQVEERKKQIWEAERERREYIMRKNQERETRLENKRKNERGQIAFAFGSSTPRMIETVDCSGMGMSASFWATRRATSISNVAINNTTLTRRSSERELGETKKRATSASGLDRQSGEDQRQMSSSMYEIFNWGAPEKTRPNKLTFSIAGSSINIDEPPTAVELQAYSKYECGDQGNYHRANRRKTDLMPTIPSPRDSSRNSFGTHTPRTPARAFSMTRLDQLAQPVRRNGEHIRAIIERERQQALELENLSRMSASSRNMSPSPAAEQRRKSRSMSQLATRARPLPSSSSGGGGGGVRSTSSAGHRSAQRRSGGMMKRNDTTSKSMSQLLTDDARSTRASISRSERLRHQVKEQLSNSVTAAAGLRSGEMTPTSTYSRPGSAMSSSTTASGVVYRRSTPSARKQRPASIAITGVTPGAPPSKDGGDGGAEKRPPPIPRQSSASRKSSASNTPKEPKTARTPGSMTPKGGTPAAIQSPDSGFKSLERSIKAKTTKPTVAITEPEKVEKSLVVNEVKPEDKPTEKLVESVKPVEAVKPAEPAKPVEVKAEVKPEEQLLELIEETDMSASMIAKSKINTEEQAKAALAERRRLAREEAERQAELERQRVEAEAEAERQRQIAEEERLRKLEEETIRLAEEQRRLEGERLQQAIAEAEKREEEERQRLEEEVRAKAEKEEQDRKAREEAEKQRVEMEKKLAQEELERVERRKRVEAIMSRTRNKGSAANTPQKNADGDGDKTSDSNNSSMTQSQIAMSQSLTESMIQEIKAVSDDKELNKLQSFITNEKHENEKENSVNNGASGPHADEQQQIQNSDSSTVTPATRLESDLLIEDSIGHTNGHGNGTLEDKLKSKPVESKIANADLITDQLIDLNNFTSDVQLTNNSINLSNNNNNNNNNSLTNTTPLVASDSQDNRDLSLL